MTVRVAGVEILKMSRIFIRCAHRAAKYRDTIGPPCPRSNLRPVNLAEPPDETPLQKEYRRARLEVHSWNRAFWSRHNVAFANEREKFIAEHRPSDGTAPTADEMSVFYKSFLDKNWKNHVDYNIRWYGKNIAVLILSLRVAVEKFYLRSKF